MTRQSTRRKVAESFKSLITSATGIHDVEINDARPMQEGSGIKVYLFTPTDEPVEDMTGFVFRQVTIEVSVRSFGYGEWPGVDRCSAEIEAAFRKNTTLNGLAISVSEPDIEEFLDDPKMENEGFEVSLVYQVQIDIAKIGA